MYLAEVAHALSLTCYFLSSCQADVDEEYELNKVKPQSIALAMGKSYISFFDAWYICIFIAYNLVS